MPVSSSWVLPKAPGRTSLLKRSRDGKREGILEYLGVTRDVRPYVGQANVVVLPSWREGLPCSLMEAMSMGRPIVATDVPGCRDVVVDGKNGFLVPVRTPEALAKALESFFGG